MGTGTAESVFGQKPFYRETWGTKGVAMWLNVVLNDHRVAYPYVKVQVRELVRVVGIVALFAQRRPLPGTNSFYRALASKWAQTICSGCPQQRYAMGEPGKVQGQDRMGIVEGSFGYRARGVKVKVRDLVRGVGIVAPFAPRGSVPGGNFSSPRV